MGRGHSTAAAVAALTGALALSQFFRSCLAVIAPELSHDLGLTPATFGVLSSSFFIAFAAAQLPVGLAFDRWGVGRPSTVLLAADKFHAYLHDEGLDTIVRQREAAGSAATPGRERFRRSAKSLLAVGGKADGASTRVAGQRLEITPLSDPLQAAAGDTVRFSLRYEGQPRAGVLVKAWHRGAQQTTVLRATTDANGLFAFTLPFGGGWMLNAVHMVPATGAPDIDWDSFWSSLTFELRARR